MELLDLQIFARVARERSISRAAAGLHMAQPTVSQRLQGLEVEIGRELFIRHRRGVTLTPQGEVLVDYASRVLGLLTEGVAAARSTPGAILRINLAAPSSVNGYFVPPLLRVLADDGHDVSVYDAHSSEVMQLVLDGTVHAGFVLGVPAQPGVHQHLLRREPIICVAHADHPLAARTRLRMADLAGHRVARYNFSGESMQLWAALADATAAPLRGVVKVTPVEACRALALTGEFITFVPAMTVAEQLAEGRLVALPVVDLPTYSWNIALAYRERKQPTAELRTLLAVVDSLWGSDAVRAD
jgi:DNA-binding transcriptional LysR family regulator